MQLNEQLARSKIELETRLLALENRSNQRPNVNTRLEGTKKPSYAEKVATDEVAAINTDSYSNKVDLYSNNTAQTRHRMSHSYDPKLNSIPVLIGHKPVPNPNQWEEVLSKKNRQKSLSTKIGVLVTGDSNMRGLGPKLQAKDIDALAIVRSGATLKQAGELVSKDADEVIYGTYIISGYGLNDVRDDGIHIAKTRMQEFIHTQERIGPHVNFGILAVPPQKDPTINALVTELNNFTKHRCLRNGIVSFIDANLTGDNLKIDGIHLNPSGQRKVTDAIKAFARVKSV